MENNKPTSFPSNEVRDGNPGATEQLRRITYPTIMQFDLNRSLEILERTPATIEAMLDGLSDEWTKNNEGPGTWSPYDIVGHLIHGEKTDWIPRMEIILSDKTDKSFEPFDRFAQFEQSKGKNLRQLLDEFKILRK